MERPYELLTRISSCVPVQDRPRLLRLAEHLEGLGRLLPLNDLSAGALSAIRQALEQQGIVLSASDVLIVSEAWDRPPRAP